jgi:hypothetical protein
LVRTFFALASEVSLLAAGSTNVVTRTPAAINEARATLTK